jgi:hypothetical protein
MFGSTTNTSPGITASPVWTSGNLFLDLSNIMLAEMREALLSALGFLTRRSHCPLTVKLASC